MRNLIFSTVFLAIAVVGVYAVASTKIATSQDTKAATFAERFAPALASSKGSS